MKLALGTLGKAALEQVVAARVGRVAAPAESRAAPEDERPATLEKGGAEALVGGVALGTGRRYQCDGIGVGGRGRARGLGI